MADSLTLRGISDLASVDLDTLRSWQHRGHIRADAHARPGTAGHYSAADAALMIATSKLIAIGFTPTKAAEMIYGR